MHMQTVGQEATLGVLETEDAMHRSLQVFTRSCTDSLHLIADMCLGSILGLNSVVYTVRFIESAIAPG